MLEGLLMKISKMKIYVIFWILTYKIQEQYSKEKTYNECKEILYTAQKRNHKKIQFIKDKK